jgi:hypothetical protein
MSKAAEYRRFARECLQIAERTSPEQRPLLVEMARTWHQLAQEHGRPERDARPCRGRSMEPGSEGNGPADDLEHQ